MAKRTQPARLLTADGVDLTGYVTQVTLTLDPTGIPVATVTMLAHIDVDPATEQITVTVGGR